MQYLQVHVLKNQIQEKHEKKERENPILIFYWTGNIQIH